MTRKNSRRGFIEFGAAAAILMTAGLLGAVAFAYANQPEAPAPAALTIEQQIAANEQRIGVIGQEMAALEKERSNLQTEVSELRSLGDRFGMSTKVLQKKMDDLLKRQQEIVAE